MNTEYEAIVALVSTNSMLILNVVIRAVQRRLVRLNKCAIVSRPGNIVRQMEHYQRKNDLW